MHDEQAEKERIKTSFQKLFPEMTVQEGVLPPNFKEISDNFDISDKEVVFSYGSNIYNPKNGTVQDHLMIHESVHGKQHSIMGVEEWWKRYIADPEFRLGQEVEAYGVQYAFIKMTRSGRNVKTFLKNIAIDLSSEIYGNIIEYGQANSAIRLQAKRFLEENDI